VGIGLKATLKMRKLLILLNAKNAKNIKIAQPRYPPGIRAKNESCTRYPHSVPDVTRGFESWPQLRVLSDILRYF
jgi:hypothetical protein